MRGLSDEVCVVVVTDSALVAGKDTDDHQDHLAGATANPDGRWVAQQARNLSLTAALDDITFLIRDRDSKFTGGF